MRAPQFIRGVGGDWIAVAHIVMIGKAYHDPNRGQDVHAVLMRDKLYVYVSPEEIARIVR